MKYDYSMSDGDFYRTYGMSQEQAAASKTSDSWGATEYVVLAGVVGAIWYFWPSKPAKKYKFKSVYKEAPVAAAFKYA